MKNSFQFFVLTFNVQVHFGNGNTSSNLNEISALFFKNVIFLSFFLGSAIKEREGITSVGNKQRTDLWLRQIILNENAAYMKKVKTVDLRMHNSVFLRIDSHLSNSG